MLLLVSGLVVLCIAKVPTNIREPAGSPTTTEEPEPLTWIATVRSPSLFTEYPRGVALKDKRSAGTSGGKHSVMSKKKRLEKTRSIPPRTRTPGSRILSNEGLWDDIGTAINVEPSLETFVYALHSLVRTLYGASKAEMLSVLTFDQLATWEAMRDELIPASARGASGSGEHAATHVGFVRNLLGLRNDNEGPVEILRDESEGGADEDRDSVVLNALESGTVPADDMKLVYASELNRVISGYLEKIRGLTSAVSTSPRHNILNNRPLDPSIGPFEAMWSVLGSNYLNFVSPDLMMFASEFPQWASHLGHLDDEELVSIFNAPTSVVGWLTRGGRNALMDSAMVESVRQVDVLLNWRGGPGDSLDDLFRDRPALQEAAYIVLLSDIKGKLSTWTELLIRGNDEAAAGSSI